MPGYVLVCTLCKNSSAESRASWLTHLLREDHQRAARSEIGRWGKRERKTALVVYANFQLSTYSGGLPLLQHFSNAVGFPVTDFVTIPGRPQVAVLQFDSRSRARKIAEEAGGAKVSINGQQEVQLRKAEGYHNIQWQALLSTFSDSAVSAVGGGDREARSKMEVRKRKLVERNRDGSGDQGEANNAKKRKERAVAVATLQPEPEPPETPSPSELRLQYDELCRSVEIPDQEFDVAVRFLQKLEEVASTKIPPCKLYMFRTWHLKLRSLGGNELLLFIDAQGYLSGQSQIDSNPVKSTRSILYGQGRQRRVIKDVFSGAAEAELQQLGMTFSRRDNKDAGKFGEFVCSHPASGAQFTIWPHVLPWLVQEVQACQMLQYLATFDIRVKPLYTLISYWTNMNNIKLSHRKTGLSGFEVTPEPAAMEWLIMLFLCNKKIVPTPREILDRNSPGRTHVIKVDVEIS